MKKIYMVFNDQEKSHVSDTLYENMRYVLQHYVDIELCFLDHIRPEEIADGDLFLVLYDNRVHQMSKYISSLEKVMVMSRTIQKKFLTELFSIAPGTDVLVVNDSDESTLQTTNLLYRLGLTQVRLHPYVSGKSPDTFKNIKVAITPNEEALVPSHIEKIFNIYDRYLDVSTFMNIISRLEIDTKKVIENLLAYSDIVAEPNKSSSTRYVNEHLKTAMFKDIINESSELVVLTDRNYSLEYANKRALKTFGNMKYTEDIIYRIKASHGEFFQKEDYKTRLFTYNEVNYLVSRRAVKYGDQLVGYSFIFQDEMDIKDTGENLNKNLAKTGLVAKYTFDDLFYASSSMTKAVSLAKKVAVTDMAVLITGESGTGKELIAQSIHNHSLRKNHPFVAINCAALPASLLESELFGYEKGAFTGANKEGKTGLFEQANRGTIFLDEIGDMPLELQARILRVLQEKQLMKVGSDRLISVDIRVIAATNKDLTSAIANHEFREDLYYRLCNIQLELPPLRKRGNDVLLLFEGLLGDKSELLSARDKKALVTYSWPGNVRELKNVADYFSFLNELPKNILEGYAPVIVSEEKDTVDKKILSIIQKNTSEASGIGRTSILYALRDEGITISDDKLRKRLAALEKDGKIIIGKGRKGCMAR